MPLPSSLPVTTLIIVCCHGIWLGGPTNGLSESEWAIEPFQHGETPTLILHAETGVSELLKANGQGLLIYSGAATKRHRTPLSEAESYHNLVRARNTLPASQAHLSEFILEDRNAVDSLQNLLFSLLLFCKHVGHGPEKIVLVSHAFKERRFVGQYCATLRLPVEKVVYCGLDPEWGDDGEKRRLAEEEEEWARKQWEEDCWGWGDVLRKMRMKRGWRSEEGMHEVVFWEGGESRKERFGGVLPWD